MSPRERVIGATRFTGMFFAIVVLSTMGGSVVEELVINRLFAIADMPVISVILVGVFAGGIALLFFNWKYPKIGKLVQADADVVPISELGKRNYLITGYSPRDMPDLGAIGQLSEKEACDPKHKDILGSWQQNVRAIAMLREKAGLKVVYVIDPGTHKFTEFQRTMTAVFGDTIEVKLVNDPDEPEQPYIRQTGRKKINPGYEDFGHVQASIHRALKLIGSTENARRGEFEERVAIDITPGTKTYSMAASIATLNTDMVAVYTTTFSDDPWVLIPYNASIRLGESPS